VDIILTQEDEDVDEDTILVDFDGMLVPYTRSELDELCLLMLLPFIKLRAASFLAV